MSQNQDATRKYSLPLRYQWGIQTRDFLVDHQIEILWECKNADYSDARSPLALSASRTEFILNSDS